MDRICRTYGRSVWFRSVAVGAVALFGLVASAPTHGAHAQYRAGAFVDGQPMFGRRRASGDIMRLRGRRAAKRRDRRSRSQRRRRQRPVQAALPALPVERDLRPDAAPPPLPTLNPKPAVSDAQRARLRKQQRLAKRKKVMQIVVSLGRQRMTVYQDTHLISRSGISSGKKGHQTPTGVFSIIQKRRHHRSNIYSNAPMPFMQRITWSGIALHEGRLPGYAASHGCVRLPGRFARKLFKTTKMRTHVVIARGNPIPRAFSHPNLPGVSDLGDVQLARLATPSDWFRARIRRRFGHTNARSQTQTLPVHLASSVGHGLPAQSGRLRAYDAGIFKLAAMLHFDQSEMVAHRQRVTRTRSSAPLRVLVTRRTQRDQIRDVQRRLAVLGYDVGELDGQLGRQTIALIKSFQQANKLRVTGHPDVATRDLLDVRSALPRPSAATVYVRQGGRQIYTGPIALARADEPVGTHLYTLIDLDEEEGDAGTWTAMTLQAKGRLPSWSTRSWKKRLAQVEAVDAHQAIGRITFPAHVRATIEDRLTPGSSLIIADRGSERETGLATDFVVLTD